MIDWAPMHLGGLALCVISQRTVLLERSSIIEIASDSAPHKIDYAMGNSGPDGLERENALVALPRALRCSYDHTVWRRQGVRSVVAPQAIPPGSHAGDLAASLDGRRPRPGVRAVPSSSTEQQILIWRQGRSDTR